MTEKPAKPTASKPASSRTPSTRHRQPDQDEIATHAYFIHLEQDADDQLTNWLRAEHELTTA